MNFTDKEKQKIISDLCKMIQCKTVSNINPAKTDWKEFEKFTELLKKQFPKIYLECKFYKVGKTGLVHKIAGTAKNPNHAVVLMAHYDVVPADENEWSFKPFSGDVYANKIRGRGTMDTKGTLCACLEAVEMNLKKGWKPENDLYLCFSGEEEINGPSCPQIVEWFQKKKIKVDFVLDEGGAIVDKSFPGVKERCAMIGTSEKGSSYLDLIITGKPGHASAPPKHSSVGIASKIVTKLEKEKHKAQFTPPVTQMLKVMGKNNSNKALKFIFSNLWLTKPLVKLISIIIRGDLYSLLHTTWAVTRFSGSKNYNVLPSEAVVGINLRLLGKDTVAESKKRIEKIASKVAKKKASVKVNIVSNNNPSSVSDTECKQWKLLKDVIKQTWPKVLVSSYLMMACSDARNYCKITDKVYRFSGMYMSKQDRAMIHGVDEKINCDILLKTVEFYINLINRL